MTRPVAQKTLRDGMLWITPKMRGTTVFDGDKDGTSVGTVSVASGPHFLCLQRRIHVWAPIPLRGIIGKRRKVVKIARESRERNRGWDCAAKTICLVASLTAGSGSTGV